MPLVVTGSIGIDTIHTPTQVAEAVMGGSCSYFAAAASFLHQPVRMVAAVGEDWPAAHADMLGRFRVDLDGLERRSGSKTFTWTGRYFDNMNRRETVEVNLGVLAEQLPPMPAAYRDSRYVFLANTDPGSQMSFLEQLPHRKLAVADTMDLWITTQREALERLLQAIHGLILNDSESFLLTEISNPITAGRRIRETYDLDFVVVKKGEHGSLLLHRDGVAALPAFPAETVVDPTGAGDTFAGGFMGYLASADRVDFEAMQQAMAWGTVISSFTIERFALERLTELSLDQIRERLQAFARIVRVGC